MMVSALELFQSSIEESNPAIDAFMADADRIKRAITKGSVKGRSPVKLENETIYKFRMLNHPIKIDGKEKAIEYITKWVSAANDEKDEFRALVVHHYGETALPVKKPRKARGGSVAGNG